MYRPLDQIPVLAHAGSILPMTDQISAKDVEKNPKHLEIRVYAGADGKFELYEDDNVSCGYETGECAKTLMELCWDSKKFLIHPTEGNLSLVPEKRDYTIRIMGSTAREARVSCEGETKTAFDEKNHELTVVISDVATDKGVEITLPENTQIASNPVMEQVDQLLNKAEIEFTQKEILFALVSKYQNRLNILVGELQAMKLDDALRGALMEIVTALS